MARALSRVINSRSVGGVGGEAYTQNGGGTASARGRGGGSCLLGLSVC